MALVMEKRLERFANVLKDFHFGEMSTIFI
jgi:hypothetical protein